jgi:hypothetical protein
VSDQPQDNKKEIPFDDGKDAPKSTAEKLLARRLEEEHKKKIAIEDMQEYSKALNIVAATPAGELVLKTFIRALGVFNAEPCKDAAALVAEKANRDFYFTFVRQHLDKTLRQNIEP